MSSTGHKNLEISGKHLKNIFFSLGERREHRLTQHRRRSSQPDYHEQVTITRQINKQFDRRLLRS